MSALPFLDPLFERLGWVLVHSLWQLALISLTAAALARLSSRARATTRYAMLLGMLSLMVVSPAATWILSSSEATVTRGGPGHLGESAEAIDVVAESTDGSPASAAEPFAMPPSAEGRESEASLEPASPTGAVGRHASIRSRLRSAVRPWLNHVVVAWMLGACLFASRPALSGWTVWRLRRRGVSPVSSAVAEAFERARRLVGVRGSVTVLESALARVPMVVGHLRPVVLLPVSVAVGLPAGQLETILVHELAHVRRHDYLVNAAQTMIETAFFYHPGVWWLSRLVRAERENCCDDLVISVTGDRVEYGRALMALENLKGAFPTLALPSHGGSLARRIRRLLPADSRRGREALGAGVPFGLALAAVISTAGFWALTMAADHEQGNVVFSPGYRVWFGTPTAGDELRIVMEPKRDPAEVFETETGKDMPDPVEPPRNPVEDEKNSPDNDTPDNDTTDNGATDVFRGLNFDELPATKDPHSLTGLYREEPAGSGIYQWHPDTCFLPITPDGGISVFYRPEAELFFVRRGTDGSFTWYGPVAGNPIEKLDLAPLLLESMKEFRTAGNARIALARMVRSSNGQLAATGLRLMRRMLTDPATWESIQRPRRARWYHQAEQNLDFVIDVLDKHGEALREADVEGLAAVREAVELMEAKFAAAMPKRDEDDYNDASYLQARYPDDDSIRWGPEREGMRLGMLTGEPIVLTPGIEPHSLKFYVRNVSDREQRFQLEGHVAEWVRVEVTDSAGEPVRTEAGDLRTSIKGIPLAWRLAPGEKLELCEIRLTSARPDAEVETTAIRGLRVATTRIRATPGRYTASLVAPINFRRVRRGVGEWHGSLTSAPVSIEIADRREDEDGAEH